MLQSVVGGFSPEMDRFNTEIGERTPHGLKAMLRGRMQKKRANARFSIYSSMLITYDLK
ncbi:hypothetical protein [Aliiglaciecola lipolytica]|nr:hypothetical protein [Aliiglaciecola lipolytica]MBU2877736.1 hypothetical protein [Aliiglaciecola lipolytica]